MPLSRRHFMQKTALAWPGPARAGKDAMSTGRPLFVSTWRFGKAANDKSLEVAEQGGSILGAVERGIHGPEADASNVSVGLGGFPTPQA